VHALTRTKLVPLAVAAALALVLAACGEEADEETVGEAPEGETIVLFDGQWESLWILNDIFAVIAEHGYGHEVDAPTTSTPVMMETMPQGDIHVSMEFWCMNIPDWCEQELFPDDSSVVHAGSVFEEAVQGWFVPRYVIEGDDEEGIEAVAPDLQSVADLPDYVDLFEDPEDPGSGMLLGGIDGWEVTELNRYKLHAYGLDDAYNFQSAGSAAAFDAAIVSALDRGEPVLFYYWTPAWIPGVYDLVQLEEPEWTDDCQAALDEALEAEVDPGEVGDEVGCELPSGSVELGAWAGLEDSSPELLELLRNMDGFGTELMNELTAYMELEGAEPHETALWFFGEYPDVWRDWVPDDDAVERIEDALRDQGVDV
jgi:glycine betaine/proline transport system substrate-binding protein